ncbi:MAG: PAS domain S-box protein, partial [Mucilaginibacter sp.]
DPNRMSWNGITITTQKGEERIINSKNIPLYDQNLMISTVIDVTKEFKQATAIKQAKANQEALINGTQDLIWSVDTEMHLITANHSFREMIKTITGKVLKEGDHALVDDFGKEQVEKWEGYYKRVLKGEQFTIKEHHYNPAKQITEHSLISLSPMFNEENAILGVACYSKDITADIMNLLALENTKAKLEKIMDSSMDIICSIDEMGHILSISAASETILGYKPEELIGKLLFDFIYPEDLEKTERTASSIMAGHNMTHVENRYVRKDGSLVPLTWSAAWDPKDKIRYGIARDATERKKSENALIESEKKYKYLFEKNPLPIFIWNFETMQIIDCNEQAIVKYGYSTREFLQLTIKDLRAGDDQQSFEDAKKRGTAYEVLHRRSWRHKKKNGDIMYVDVTGQVMDYKGERVVMGMVNDVTESRYYDELDRLEKEILELNARNDMSVNEVIGLYLSGIELMHPGMLCSMLEKRGNRLFNLASPSLPGAYLEAIEGIEIGINVGSCGTAAFLKQKVVATDIANDIRWANYKEIAIQHQLRTCWSYPVLDSKNNVMATIACYYREVKAPSKLEENTLQRANSILQVILESYQRENALRISNERFEYATKATSDIIWDWNLETNEVYYSGNIRSLFGHKPGISNDNLPFYFEHVHPDDRERVVLYPDQVKYGNMVNWTQEYRFRKADGEYAFVLDKGIVIRDEKGIGLRMIGAMQDITAVKQKELRIIRQNEQLTDIAQINAHEIRRPVATILGLMQLINKENIESETDRELLAHLETATHELDVVIKRIIDKTVN